MEAAVSVWRKRLAEIFKDAKIDGHSHQFRNTFAVSLLASGVSLEHVATLLGNSVKIVQKHYAPWEAKRQDAWTMPSPESKSRFLNSLILA